MVKTKEIDVKDIPKSLQDIKLGNLIAIGRAGKDEDAMMYAAFKYLLGLNREFVDGLAYKDAQYLYGLMNTACENLPEERLTFDLEVDGKIVRYGRIPNLMNITTGEMKDLDKALQDILKEDTDFSAAYKLMKVLYRPIVTEVKGLYSIVPYSEVVKTDKSIFLNAPSDVYISGKGFFLNLKNELIICTQKYIKEAEAVIKAGSNKKSSKKDGDGLATLTTLLEGISSNGKQLRLYHLSSLLPSWQSTRIGKR